MFKKKDPIFWWGWGVFALGMILYAVTEMDIFMVTIVIAFLLRPTLASMGLAKKYEDERELSIHFKSGNIAFLVVMIACVFYAAVSKTEKDFTAEMFYTVIIIGLATKGFVYVIMSKNFR
ncbi:MAG: hypothetical protein KKD38_07290, partial [Candidatus Delongbacteria bacterium]|nr:hypothetical protein [Candidatus Delongbacteria bacterium]MCG2759706.1 hypothetical protein [Candidatus Delongbacteria bacterium]